MSLIISALFQWTYSKRTIFLFFSIQTQAQHSLYLYLLFKPSNKQFVQAIHSLTLSSHSLKVGIQCKAENQSKRLKVEIVMVNIRIKVESKLDQICVRIPISLIDINSKPRLSISFFKRSFHDLF